MKTVSILIPAYNEEESLTHLFTRLANLANKLKDYEFEFLFVNDGSKDKTLDIIQDYAEKDSRVAYINLSRNFGKEIAMIAGLDHVKGDATVIIDADLQDPPELIPKMLHFWEEGFDDVYAKRETRDGETWLKQFTSKMYYRTLQSVTHIPIQEDTGDFRLLDRRVVEALKEFRESQRNTKAMFSWVGFHKKEILYNRDPRVAGETHWNYRKLINLAVDGITSFTTAPLRVATVAGMLVSVFAFIYLIYTVLSALLVGSSADGYPSMMAVILFLGGVQLLSLGIIGEYVGRIFNETKQRPLYLIEEYHGGKPSRRSASKTRPKA
ncbi:glycosyltransferase family 2 protein [Candidatus Saccharibacteria bacterium]|nr:glycosyltransferase family 2 protein [Candidatus Saccharibacteria bacterium]